MYITLGSDPEFPIWDSRLEKYISSVGKVGGTKKEPLLLEEGLYVQEDNVAVEITIQPCKTLEEIYSQVDRATQIINERLLKKNQNWALTIASSGVYSTQELKSEAAQTMGCEPALNIYQESAKAVTAAMAGTLRTFGFHIHFGFEDIELNGRFRQAFIFLCDLHLGLPSMLYDKDVKRRSLYGNLGDYRETSYGVEYRTLGGNMYNNFEVVKQGLEKIKNTTQEEMYFLYEKYFDRLKNITDKTNKLSIKILIAEINSKK